MFVSFAWSALLLAAFPYWFHESEESCLCSAVPTLPSRGDPYPSLFLFFCFSVGSFLFICFHFIYGGNPWWMSPFRAGLRALFLGFGLEGSQAVNSFSCYNRAHQLHQIEFQILAIESGWNEPALIAAFCNGLVSHNSDGDGLSWWGDELKFSDFTSDHTGSAPKG